MIEAAEAEGQIEPGRTTIVEATSGNTGIALAFVCAAKGYELVLTLPQGMSRERESLLRAVWGAREHHRVARRHERGRGGRASDGASEPDVFLPDQFSNPANPEVHRRTTGPEIERALDGRVDVLVAGVGTGGTITGAGGYLRERNPDLRDRRGGATRLGRALRWRARAASHPRDRRGVRARGARTRADRRGDTRLRRRRDPHRVGVRAAGGRARGHLLWGGAVGGAATRRASGVGGQANSRDHARLGRALRVAGIFCTLRVPWAALRCQGMSGLSVAQVAKELRRDIAAARARDPAARGVGQVEILATWPGIHALLAHRVAHALHEAGVPLAPRAIALCSRTLTGIEIHPAARIGEGLFIDHGAGVVIGETADIGNDVTLYQGVTLGGTGFATGKRHPTVQDNVTIGSGAKLLGPITIGHGAKIGANSVVITDVPPNSTVVGNPGHPVRVDGRRVEGPDADWIHLPDPIAEAIQGLASRIGALERAVSEISGEEPEAPVVEVTPLRSVRGPNPAGG